ncbi:MAG: AGE family epimerase/isomerase [Bacteroidota bacterium]|nr:N-acyl-D-glucosamine 2-epimerase [Odoribacter sp.]MDP3644847.1 AGE family epimerase/isomerase [Bacteroidota bacterium]
MTIGKLKSEVRAELINNILPFWSERMPDEKHRGFYGQIDGNDRIIPEADKGGILNARILWTFSSAYLQEKNPVYLKMANRAKEYILKHFFDPEYGGTYWTISFDGKPVDTKKQIYSQAFFLYAFTEHYRATGDESSLHTAIQLFQLIEKHSFDNELNGYFEAYSRDWILLEDLRLSAKDENEKKTMNTHLHILEAYTNLYRVWKDDWLATQLRNLIEIFTVKIVNQKTKHLDLFFDENWNAKSTIVSYGHDIEASWLINEAASVLGDQELLSEVQQICIKVAESACGGLQPDGSLVYEFDKGILDTDRHWWVQAEGVVGFLNAFELTGKSHFLEKAQNCWNFISANLIDRAGGEWFWSISDIGIPNRNEDKAGFWKCPYHNSRMCLEVMMRVEK